MTPTDIDVLLHYHLSPVKHPRLGVLAVQDSIELLVDNGLLIQKNAPEKEYNTTTRGSAHIKQLCALPLPTKAWIGEDGKAIDI